MERLTEWYDGKPYLKQPIRENRQKLLRSLAEYEDAEEQGLLPRFHLGDEFWALRLGRVVKAKVVMLQQKKDGTWKYRFSLEISSTYHDTVDYEQIEYGKYFWSNKEEAERELERIKNNG